MYVEEIRMNEEPERIIKKSPFVDYDLFLFSIKS